MWKNVSYKVHAPDRTSWTAENFNYKDIDFNTFSENLALCVPKELIVIDMDDIEEAECVLKIINKLGVRTWVMKTTHGMHFYFKNFADAPLTQGNSKKTLAIGLTNYDTKLGNKNGMVDMMVNGVWREWIIPPKNIELIDFSEIDEIPSWMVPMKYNRDMSLLGIKEGIRNIELFKHANLLNRYGFDFDEAKIILELINNEVISAPIGENEIENILDGYKDTKFIPYDEFYKPIKGGKIIFMHDKLARYIVRELYCMKTPTRILYFFNGKYYSTDITVIQKKLAELLGDNITDSQIKEVITRINILALDTSPIGYEESEEYLSVKNGLVDVKTGKLYKHSPDTFVTHYIDVKYNENAYCPEVDKYLNELFVDKGSKACLERFLMYGGYTLFSRGHKAKKALVLQGQQTPDGSNSFNGKSLLFKIIENFLGKENTESMPLHNYSDDSFEMERLIGKLVVFEEDAKKGYIKDDSISCLKKIISDGCAHSLKRKHQNSISAFLGFKPWIASNFTIRSTQNGEEWHKRLLLVPMRNVFKPTKYGDSLFLLMTTQKAKEYWLKLFRDAYLRFMANDMIWPTDDIIYSFEEDYKMANDSTYNWIKVNCLEKESFMNHGVNDLYDMYSEYCNSNGMQPAWKEQFVDSVIGYFHGVLNTGLINGDRNFLKVNI